MEGSVWAKSKPENWKTTLKTVDVKMLQLKSILDHWFGKGSHWLKWIQWCAVGQAIEKKCWAIEFCLLGPMAIPHRNILPEYWGPGSNHHWAKPLDRFLGKANIWDHLECSDRKNKATFTVTTFWGQKCLYFFDLRPSEGQNRPLLSIIVDQRTISTLKWPQIEKRKTILLHGLKIL